MRPLRLTLHAIGPYPGSEGIDFDTLAQIKDRADIIVDGTAKIWTDARANGDANAYASGIGFGGDGESSTNAKRVPMLVRS